jgi:hypothetical protein
MARELRSNRKGIRARLDWSMFEYLKFEPPTEVQWCELETAIGAPIPQPIRERIRKVTSDYMFDAQAENAPFADEHRKALKETATHATALRALLDKPYVHAVACHGFDAIASEGPDNEAFVAEVLRAVLDAPEEAALAYCRHAGEENFPAADFDAPYVESKTAALENALARVALNCDLEMRRQAEPGFVGFVPHEAWDRWIWELLKILKESGLRNGIGTPGAPKRQGFVSPAVRFVAALQQLLPEPLLPEPLRRHEHSDSALSAAMRRAIRDNKKRR